MFCHNMETMLILETLRSSPQAINNDEQRATNNRENSDDKKHARKMSIGCADDQQGSRNVLIYKAER